MLLKRQTKYNLCSADVQTIYLYWRLANSCPFQEFVHIYPTGLCHLEKSAIQDAAVMIPQLSCRSLFSVLWDFYCHGLIMAPNIDMTLHFIWSDIPACRLIKGILPFPNKINDFETGIFNETLRPLWNCVCTKCLVEVNSRNWNSLASNAGILTLLYCKINHYLFFLYWRIFYAQFLFFF